MSMQSSGYWGRVLRIDLSKGQITEEKVAESVLRQVVGGSGFGAKVIYEELNLDTDSFDPQNRVIFAVGPWQAANFWGSGKFSVIFKSPLTGTLGDSSGGGNWAPLFKRCGYDSLIIQGKASQPVYLWIHDKGTEIKDASSFWGMDTVEMLDKLKEDVAEKRASVVAIGPGGEKLVRFACVAADGHSYAGRSGIGAVMGSKNLKAVVVYGTRKCEVFDSRKTSELRKTYREKIKKNAVVTHDHGTPSALMSSAESGNLPIKYWSGDTWDGADKLAAPRYTKILNARPMACINCNIACHRRIVITEPPEYAMKRPGPQYESLSLLGSACLVDDLKAVCKANDLCNRLGMDTISAGSCVAFTMECFERGWLTAKDTDGLEVKWGDAHALVELTRKIGMREGFGDILAEGTLRAARKINKEAEEIVVQVRGLDFPAWDPRAFWAIAVNYATGTIGSSHERGITVGYEFGAEVPELGIDKAKTVQFNAEGKAHIAVKSQDYAVLMNSLSMCNFPVDAGSLTVTELKEAFNAVTGWNWSLEQFLEVGERIHNLQRLINIRDGKGKEYDTLPKKMFQAAKTGPRSGKIPPLDRLLKDYYRIRGWNEDGVPTSETLERLGLDQWPTR